MQLLWIFLIPIIGILCAGVVSRVFPKAQFKGYDILPFFFLWSCQLITQLKHQPTFLPYGLWLYCILVIIVSISFARKDRNIRLGNLIRTLWDYLIMCSVFWYIGLIILLVL